MTRLLVKGREEFELPFSYCMGRLFNVTILGPLSHLPRTVFLVITYDIS